MKAIIIDDEIVHVRGMSRFINWARLGFDMPDGFIDALDALKAIKHGNYDVVITDIRMPNLSGLELIEKIHEAHKAVKIIIVSGYDEFVYAQRAIELGVRAYLLKPLNKESLEDAIAKCAAEIQAELPDASATNDYITGLTIHAAHPVIRTIEKYIHTHLSESLSAQKIAQNHQINASYLSTLFKKETGINLNAYIQSCRLMYAMELLKQPTVRVNEIAYRCGFGNASYFTEQFKNYYDMTPSEARRKMQQNKEDQ